MERSIIRRNSVIDGSNMGYVQLFVYGAAVGLVGFLLLRIYLSIEVGALVVMATACGLWRCVNKVLTVAVVIGAVWMCCAIEYQRAAKLPERLDKSRVVVSVSLRDIPKQGLGRDPSRIDVTLEAPVNIQGFQLRRGAKLRLSDYQHLPIAAGEQWLLEVVLRSPRSSVNPSGFDYAKWLFSQNIVATGYVVGSEHERQLARHGTFPSLLQWRMQFIHDLQAKEPLNPLLLALLVGDKSGLESRDYQRLQHWGISHLFVISGLHIGMLASLGWAVGALLMRLLWWPLYSVAGVWVPVLFALGLAFIYALLAGFSLPTQRALVMITVVMLAVVCRRHYVSWDSLLLAVVVVACLSPLALMGVSFWLSFVATGCLLVVIRSSRPWLSLVKTQAMLFVVLGAVASLFGLPTAWFGPLMNMVLIPLMTVLILPLSLFAASLAAWGKPALLLWVSGVFDDGWSWLGTWPLSDHGVFYWSLPALCLSVAAGLWLSKRIRLGVFVSMIVATVGVTVVVKLIQPNFRLTVFDVGQGLSVFVEQGSASLLFDTGAAYGSGFSMADAVIIPSVRHYGHKDIDHFVVSHWDNDHAGGASRIVETLQPESFWASRGESVLHYRLCSYGTTFTVGDVQARFVNVAQASFKSINANNRSCVLRLDYNGLSVLLTGDVELKSELALDHDDIRDIDLLIVPHHGSKTSSSEYLLRSTQPLWAVVSAGFNNRYGHPHPQVIQRYEDAGITVLNTARHGAVIFRRDWQGPHIVAMRSHQTKFWH